MMEAMGLISNRIVVLADEIEPLGDKISDLINEGCKDTYNCLVL